MFRLKFNLEGATGMPSIMKVPTGALGAETTFKAAGYEFVNRKIKNFS